LKAPREIPPDITMKTKFQSYLIIGLLLSGLLLSHSATAAVVVWSGAGANDNWSTAGNWIGGLPAGNEVVFGDNDATGVQGAFGVANSIVDASLAISRLWYTNLSTVGYHTTQIPLGVTLSITNGGTNIFINHPVSGGENQVYATVLGGGTLSVSNTTGLIILGQGDATGGKRAILDLAGLDTFTATVNRIILGQQSTTGNRANATLSLARTNFIDLTQSGTPAGLLLGEMASNSGNSQIVNLGIRNVILSDSGITVGGRKGNGLLQFNGNLVGFGEGVAFFRSRDGVGRQALWAIGDNSAQSAGANASIGTANFSVLGAVDALVDTMIIARSSTGAGGANLTQGTLTFDAGTVDVNTLVVGFQSNPDASPARGTVNVDGTGKLIVNGNLVLGRFFGGVNNSFGRINIGQAAGGGELVIKGDLIGGGGLENILTMYGGSLVLGGKLGNLVDATNTPLETLELNAGSITFDLGTAGNPTSVRATVVNLNVHNIIPLNVRGANLSPGTIELFKYYSGIGDVGGTYGFSGLELNLPSKVDGYLSNNTANASVDLVITNVSGTKWSGAVNGNWDINGTANWVNTPLGTASKYLEPTVPGDAVLFDDTATGTTTVNLTTTLSPGGILVSNVSKTYTFTGGGALSGPTAFTKRGAGTLLISNTGSNNFEGAISIEAGRIQLGGGADRLPVNADVNLANVAGAQLDLNNLNQTLGALNGGGGAGGTVALGSGTLSIAGGGGVFSGVISGSGTVVKSGGGVQVLSGANTYNGGTLISSGVLALANTSGSATGSGSVVVETNATLRLGDGSAAGSVAAGFITNNGIVQFSAATDISFSNVIVGDGGVSQSGPNVVTLAVANAYTGPTTINGGALRVTHPGALGNTSAGTQIQNPASARLEVSGGITLLEPLLVNSKQTASGNVPAVLNVSGNNTLAGPIELITGGTPWTFEVASGKLLVSGPTTNSTTTNVRIVWLRGGGEGEWSSSIGNSAGEFGTAIRKDDTGTWTLSGANSYTGNTVVSNGTLLVTGVIAGGNVTVEGGTLGGTGSISAPVTIYPGGTLSPGISIGKLNIFNSLTLLGTTAMELSRSGSTVTNDQVSVLTALTLGGTLNASLTGTVSGGEVFQLFTAGSIAGEFQGFDLPSLPGGLTWNTDNLAVNGTLSISGGAPVLNISQTGNMLTFSWTQPGFKLQAQTNSINVGLSNNWHDYPGGAISPVNVTVNPVNATVFFRLISQ
jgi:autotransporter-associated beta strand protein